MKTKNDILTLIQTSAWHMRVLKAVRIVKLPDGWIAAGFVRNLVWDKLHDYPQCTPLNDVDVVYYDVKNTSELAEKQYEERLRTLMPDVPWSVKNQARMHIKNHDPQYKNVGEALSHWCEAPTAVGVRLNDDNGLELIAPLGIEDLVSGICRATPFTLQKPGKIDDYRQRVKDKKWQVLWPNLKIHDL